MSLVSRMVATGRVEDVIAAGVEPRHLIDPAMRAVYETCVDHVRTWRTPPSREAVMRRHPDFEPTTVLDDLGYLIEEFRVDRTVKAGIAKWQDIGDMLDRADAGDAESRARVVDLFMEHARELAALVPMPRSSRMSDMLQRMTAIRRQQDAGRLPGVHVGIGQLDPWVYVVRPTEVVVHCAAPGVGKTTGLVRCVERAYEQGDDALFLSLEMEEDEVWSVFDARVAQLSRRAILRRELSVDDYDRYQRAAERVAGARNDVIVFDDVDGAPTIDKLAALVERYKPQTVGVDYISLMASHIKAGADWERVTLISRALKQLARGAKIRLHAAAQNNRDAFSEGPTMDNIAYSLSIGQDANVVIGYHQDSEAAKLSKIEVRLLKNRNGAKPLTWFYEHWDRDHMIFEDWTAAHAWQAKLGGGEAGA